MTPYTVAFQRDPVLFTTVTENFINACFLIDVVINFFSAYYDNEYDIIADHNVSLAIKTFSGDCKKLSNLMVLCWCSLGDTIRPCIFGLRDKWKR